MAIAKAEFYTIVIVFAHRYYGLVKAGACGNVPVPDSAITTNPTTRDREKSGAFSGRFPP